MNTAPKSEDWATLVTKVGELNRGIKSLPAEAIRSIKASVLIVIGDSDIVLRALLR